ncbi:nitroreductase [Pseudomonas putida]|nr:nitroreductase [Pseudomonas putida]
MKDTPAHLTGSPDADLLKRLLGGRSTCRAYRADEVPLAVIEDMVDIARRTPSWCNTQPWQVLVTSGASTEAFRQALMARALSHTETDSDIPFPDAYRDVYAERRREAGFKLYEALGIARGDKERYAQQSLENFRMFGAPHVAILTTRADLGPYAAVDCGGFISAFLLAAQAHGVATAPQAALARHARFIREYFAIGDDRHMVCGISFGYADTEHPVNSFRTSRASLNEVLRIV